MLQPRVGDLLEVYEDDEYYYLIILSKIVLFGGNIVYVFHYHGPKLSKFDDLIKERISGFNAVVDLIVPKREGNVRRVLKLPDYTRFLKTRYFKGTHTLTGKASEWWIYDLDHNLVARTSKPSNEMKNGMNYTCLSFTNLSQLVKENFVPSKDPRL